MPVKSNNILVRDLSPNQLVLLEKFQKKQGISTRSKAVLHMIENHAENQIKIENQDELIKELTSNLSSLKADISTFNNAFSRIYKLDQDE